MGKSLDEVIIAILDGLGSPELDEALKFLCNSDTSHFSIRFVRRDAPKSSSQSSSSKQESSDGKDKVFKGNSHRGGDTRIVMASSGEKDPKFIQEQVLTDPLHLFDDHGFTVLVTVYYDDDTDPAQAAVTLLHELELHAVHAVSLLVRLEELRTREAGLDAAIDMILAYTTSGEHGDLPRLEAYLRAAAKIRDKFAGTQLERWAIALFHRAGVDAVELLAGAEIEGKGGQDGLDRVTYLNQLIDQLGGEDVQPQQPPPSPTTGTPISFTIRQRHSDEDCQGMIADLALEQKPLEMIVETMAKQHGFPRQKTIEYYNRIVVPAIYNRALTIAQTGETDLIAGYMLEYGVPQIVVSTYLRAQGHKLQSEPEPDQDKSGSKRVRSFRTGVREDDWTMLSNHYVPAAVLAAADELPPRTIIKVDGYEMRVLYTDNPERQGASKVNSQHGAFMFLVIPLRGG